MDYSKGMIGMLINNQDEEFEFVPIKKEDTIRFKNKKMVILKKKG